MAELTRSQKMKEYNKQQKQRMIDAKRKRDNEKSIKAYDLKRRIENGTATDAEKKQHEASLPQISLHQKYNPGLYKNGVFSPPEAGLLKEAPAYTENFPTLSPDQDALAELLTQTVKDQLPDFMNRLKQPAAGDMSSKLDQMFGHMQNPILQGFLNPSMGQNAQAIFPSQMQNRMSPGIEGLMGLLGGQAGQYVGEQAPEWWKYAQQNAPAAYNYAAQSSPGQFVQNLPGNFMNLLSSLGDRFRGNQQPQQ